MPVDDQDPAYRLVDSDGNIVGTVYGTDSGDLAVQNESGTETLFTDDGIETPAVETDELNREIRAISRYADSGSGTVSDPFTSASGTGGFNEAMDALPDSGGMIFWDGHSEFSSKIEIPETQYNLYVVGSHLGGGVLSDSFSDTELFDIRIDGDNNPREHGGTSGGMLHVFEGLSFNGNKANVTGDVDFLIDTEINGRVLKSWFNYLYVSDFSGRGFVMDGNIGRLNHTDVEYCDGAGVVFKSGDIRATDCTINNCGKSNEEAGLIFRDDARACQYIGGEVTICDEDTTDGVQVEFIDDGEGDFGGNKVIGTKLQARPNQDTNTPYRVEGVGNGLIDVFGQKGTEVNDYNVFKQDDVSTTATRIWTIPSNRSATVLVVAGYEDGSSVNEFVDLVYALQGSGKAGKWESATQGSPADSTYDISGRDVELTMSSGTYSVAVNPIDVNLPGV